MSLSQAILATVGLVLQECTSRVVVFKLSTGVQFFLCYRTTVSNCCRWTRGSLSIYIVYIYTHIYIYTYIYIHTYTHISTSNASGE